MALVYLSQEFNERLPVKHMAWCPSAHHIHVYRVAAGGTHMVPSAR